MPMWGDDQGAFPAWLRAGADGVGWGLGMFRDEHGEVLTASHNNGAWDTPQGTRKYGFETNVNGLKYNGGTGVDVDIATFNQGITDDGSTFSMGGQLNGGAIAFSGSEPDKNSQDDHAVRAGWSGGMGGALRFHHGDEDGDGYRELGYGIDAGPVSLDYKSENPLELAVPGLGLIKGAIDLMDDSEHTPLKADNAVEEGGESVVE